MSNICQNQGVDACIFKMICEIFVKYFYLLNQCVFIIAVLYTVLQKKNHLFIWSDINAVFYWNIHLIVAIDYVCNKYI